MSEEHIFSEIYEAINLPDEEGAECIRVLLEASLDGVDLQSQTSIDPGWGAQYNALTYAIVRHKASALKVMVKHLRKIERGIKPGATREQNPIQLAIACQNAKCWSSGRQWPGGKVTLKTLLELSTVGELSAAVGNARSRETAWHYAAEENVEEVFTTFEKDLKGALPICKNSQSQTAFHVAAERGHLGIVKYLSTVVGDVVLLQDENDETALHLAVRNGHWAIAEHIVNNYPTSVSICNQDMKSPFLITSKLNQDEERMGRVLELIKEKILRLAEDRLQDDRSHDVNTPIEQIRKLLYGEDFRASEKDLFLDLSLFDQKDGFEKWLSIVPDLKPAVKFETCLLEVKLPELRHSHKQQHQCLMSSSTVGTQLPANIVFGHLKSIGVKTVVQVRVRDCPSHPHSDGSIIQSLQGLLVRKLNWRKLDMEVEVLFQAVREVEELTLYYGCNEEVLDRWTGYEGLRRLKRLKKIRVEIAIEEYNKQLEDHKRKGITEQSLFASIRQRFADVIHHNHLIQLTYDPENCTLTPSESCPNSCPSKPLFEPVEVYFENIPVEKQEDLSAPATPLEVETFEQKMEQQLTPLIRLNQELFKDRADVVYMLGRKTRVAILDAGIDASQFPNIIGKSFLEDSGVDNDFSASHWHTVSNPHGTQMAHLIRKMDPLCLLYIAKVAHNHVQISAAIEAVKWAVKNEVDIISISWTGPKEVNKDLQDALKTEIRTAVITAGILVFCATGDQGQDAMSSYPASYEETISIASTTRQGVSSPRTEEGNASFLLPTEGIETKTPDYLPPSAELKGSSAATAVASGLASLILTCARFAYRDYKSTTSAQNDMAEKQVSKFKKNITMQTMFSNLCSPNRKSVQPERLLSKIENIQNLQPDEFKESLKGVLNVWLGMAETKPVRR